MLYETIVTKRRKDIHISNLTHNSAIKIKVKCPCCKKVFNRYFFRLNESGNFLCQGCTIKEQKSKSLQIGLVSNRLTVLGKSEKSGYSKCVCECSKALEVSNRSILSGHTQSCGCLQKEKVAEIGRTKEKLTLEKHPNWKGGISVLNAELRTSLQYSEWRTKVFTRDAYKCQSCFSKSNKLNAHHIESFSNNKEVRMDITNGITLCYKCHSDFHKEFGRVNATKENLNSFMLQLKTKGVQL